jgi:hypothetical protein
MKFKNPDGTDIEVADDQVQAQIDKAVAESTAGLKNKNDELLGKLKKAPRLPDGFDLEKAQAALDAQEKAEEERQRASGNFDTLTKQMAEKHAAELKKIADERDALLTRAQVREKKAAAIDAITKLGANTTLLLPHVMGSIDVKEVDGETVVRVVDGKGNALVADGSGTPMTVEQFVESLREKPDFAGAFPPSGSSGGGARGTANVNGGQVIVLTEAEGRDPVRYRAAKAEAEKRGLQVVIR